MLWGMTLIDALIHHDRNGIAIIADAAESSVDALVDRGMERDRAEQLMGAAEVYFGQVRNRRAQDACVAAARENQHRLETLAFIARSSRSLETDADRWKYRTTLCETRGDLRAITRRARALKKELQPARPREPKATITFHDQGWSTMHLTARTSDVLPLFEAAKGDPAGWAKGGGATAAPAAALTTVLNMDIGDFAQWRKHPEHTEEIEVQLTNGEWLIGAELINRKLRESGYIALISPTDGPINLYGTTLRHASREMRLLMSADAPTCAWKDCNQPADFSEAHHIHEWSKGGTTTIDNLCWLCTYHNRENGRPHRGRMERVDGQIVWKSPGGYVTPRGRNHGDPWVRAKRLATTAATGPPVN